MRSLDVLIPGDLDARTGGYIYDAKIIAGLKARQWSVHVHSLHACFPDPNAEALAHLDAVLASIGDDRLVLVDSLAFGAIPAANLLPHQQRLRLIALVHHPLANETGLSAQRVEELALSERKALALARHVIVTGAQTADNLMVNYGLQKNKISVVEPGTERANKITSKRAPNAPVNLLNVASVTPRKGYDWLINALAPLQHKDWQLRCVGSTTRAPHTMQALLGLIAQHQLTQRIIFTGEVDENELQAHYLWADVFVAPTRFEGYGMALAQALAYGLPIITSAGGAAAETVGADAALLVACDDVHALQTALERVIDQSMLRSTLAAAASKRAAQLPDWQRSIDRMQTVLLQQNQR